MSRKAILWLLAGFLVIAAVVAAAFWFFGGSQKTETSRQPQASNETSVEEKSQADVPPLSIEVANELTGKLLNSDPAVYQSIWAQPAQMPMPPEGTTLTLHQETLESHEVVAHAKATLTMPGKEASEVNVWYQYVTTKDGKAWKIRGIQ